MSAKVDMSSAVEPRSTKMSATSTSAASPSSQKVSMFTGKSGFVIPKNKLSGSLVPLIRGSKNMGGGDVTCYESTKMVQRKTKWAPDLTQDASVKRGRALAYQTRVDQITQQLKAGSLEFGDTQDSTIGTDHQDQRSPSPQSDSKELELLELEKREAIGEILKLNPSYKAPPDYKPLLKESRVPIPVKEYPGFNFVGLIFGPGGDNQRRLEKETGAKIQLYGTKAETGKKGEIKASDGNEILCAYEELYVEISAETFEKVDAAVSIIELLVTSVSGNLIAVSTTSTSVSVDTVDVLTQSQDAATSNMVSIAAVNQVVLQPLAGPTHNPFQGQAQFPGPWFPSGQSPGLIPLPNSSSPILNNPVQLSSLNPSNMPSLFGPRPTPATGLGSSLQNPPVLPGPQAPSQVTYMVQTSTLGHIGPLRNPLMMALQHSAAQPTISAPFPFTGSQHISARPTYITGPLMASLPQSMSSIPPRSILDRTQPPTGSSSLWSGVPGSASASASLGQSNMGQMAPQMVQPNRPHSTASLMSPVIFPSRPSTPQLSGASVNRPIAALHFASNPPPQGGHPVAFSATLHQSPAPIPNSSINPGFGSAPIPSPGSSTQPPLPLQSGIPNSVSTSTPNFNAIKPPTVSAPSSGNFTFQPHRPQNPVSQTFPPSSSQPATQSAPQVQHPAPQVPPFQLAAPRTTQPVNQVFQRSHFSNLVSQPQRPVSAGPFARTPMGPPRLPSIPNANLAPRSPLPQMGTRNFSPAPQMTSLPGPFAPRPSSSLQLQHNYPAHMTRTDLLLAPKQQQFGSTFSFASSRPASKPGGQQIYDPFSPTSVSTSKAEGEKMGH